LPGCSLAVIRVDEVEVRSLEQLVSRVAEDLLRGRVQPGEAPLEVGHRDQVGREVEDAVELVLRPRSSRRVEPERRREAGKTEAASQDDPWQRRRGAIDGSDRQDDLELLPCLGE